MQNQKGYSTKVKIERFIKYFHNQLNDNPTQREVSFYLGISERNVQRYYKGEKFHKFHQNTSGNRFIKMSNFQ